MADYVSLKKTYYLITNKCQSLWDLIIFNLLLLRFKELNYKYVLRLQIKLQLPTKIIKRKFSLHLQKYMQTYGKIKLDLVYLK